MYGWIFRHLPGPKWLKVVEAIIIIAAIIFALFTWVFPIVHDRIYGDVTVV